MTLKQMKDASNDVLKMTIVNGKYQYTIPNSSSLIIDIILVIYTYINSANTYEDSHFRLGGHVMRATIMISQILASYLK